MGATNEVASERDGWRRIPCRGNAVVILFEIIEPCPSGLRGDFSRRPTGLSAMDEWRAEDVGKVR